MTTDPIQKVLQYHEVTKHHSRRYARGPGHMDWATQPSPFRRYEGARLIPLDKVPPGQEPLYDDAFVPGRIPCAPLNFESISQLFFDSLAISAWKSIQTATWSLRVNPSSGNLHPTEGYLICGPIEGLCEWPMICHYAPKEHALEVRAEFSIEVWRELTQQLPQEVLFIGLTSIHWREAWKYGERAYRYCQHDVGHAIGAVSIAAGGLGWQARLLDDLSTEDLASLAGVLQAHNSEPEEPDCLMALCPHDEGISISSLNSVIVDSFRTFDWKGTPNHLSSSSVDWGMEKISAAARKPRTDRPYESFHQPPNPWSLTTRPVSLRQIIRQRRSAVAMDSVTTMNKETFYHILLKTLAVPDRIPFNTLPWKPTIHLAIFVHRVIALPTGLYCLVRDPSQKRALQTTFTQVNEWIKPEGCPEELDLYLLIEADVRNTARQVSCFQEIASESCFSLGMIAEFVPPLERFGPWFYPRLFWETGVIGQVLYLEAEATGIRSTGIGCFHDDPMHEVLGLQGRQYQDLYHFTIGGAVEDSRLTTLPAYPDEETDADDSDVGG